MPDIPSFTDDQWKELSERLTLYADHKLMRLRWRGAKLSRGGTVPGGIEAGDLAAEAIVDWINGKRNWNREAVSDLWCFLRGIVDSKVNHLVESIENKITRRLDRSGDQPEESPARQVAANTLPPDKICADREEMDRLRAAITKELGPDPLALRVFECLEADITKSVDHTETGSQLAGSLLSKAGVGCERR